jgi:hypothetical protein
VSKKRANNSDDSDDAGAQATIAPNDGQQDQNMMGDDGLLAPDEETYNIYN